MGSVTVVTERATARTLASADRRRKLLWLAHDGAKLLGMDDDTRRAAQAAFTGHQSLKDCTDTQLVAWCWELKRRGADIFVPGPAPKGGTGFDRPTAAQLGTIDRLAAGLGLDEGAVAGFVRRTLGVDDPRFMSKAGASRVISGLTRWAQGRGVETASKTRQAMAVLLDEDNPPQPPLSGGCL